MSEELVITRLAHRGDGVAETASGPVFVPFALPGERVRIGAVHKGRAVLEAVLDPSAERADPACPHFTDCGGCALQHMADGAVAAFKREIIAGALKAQGVNHDVIAPGHAVPLHSRRRVALQAVNSKAGVVLGFSARGSHSIVNLCDCTVAHPEIVAALPAIRDLFRTLLSERSRGGVQMTASETGLDLDLSLDRDPTLDDRFDLADWAQARDWARLSWNGEILSERRAPLLTLNGVPVHLPVGAFLQASAQTDRLFATLIGQAVQGARTVVDLFSGVGTIALPLASSHAVAAVEGDKAACRALGQAADLAAGQGRIKPVRVMERDLFRRPLMASELKAVQAVVFDPPRAGAQAQCEELAKSDVPLIVGVSCDPKSFARDARILTEAGYRLAKVTPIDQFRFSPHVEMIGVFRR